MFGDVQCLFWKQNHKMTRNFPSGIAGHIREDFLIFQKSSQLKLQLFETSKQVTSPQNITLSLMTCLGLHFAGTKITLWLIKFLTIFSILVGIGMLKNNMTPKVNWSTDLHLWLIFGLMIQDVRNENNRWASSGNAKNDAFERRTSLFLFRSRKSSNSKTRIILLLLAFLSSMKKSVIVILLLNFYMQNQRNNYSSMLHQQRRKYHFRRRHLTLLQREHHCHQILHQREQIHLQKTITVATLSGSGIRIIVWNVWNWIEHYML